MNFGTVEIQAMNKTRPCGGPRTTDSPRTRLLFSIQCFDASVTDKTDCRTRLGAAKSVYPFPEHHCNHSAADLPITQNVLHIKDIPHCVGRAENLIGWLRFLCTEKHCLIG
jgi:hypothetical protein